MFADYEIVELECLTPMLPGQWFGRLHDGRKITIRNDTYDAVVRVLTAGEEGQPGELWDRIYMGMSVDNDHIAVSVICSNAGIKLSCPKVEGMA